MIPRGHASVMKKDCFHDGGVSQHIMYCCSAALVQMHQMQVQFPGSYAFECLVRQVVTGGEQNSSCSMAGEPQWFKKPLSLSKKHPTAVSKELDCRSFAGGDGPVRALHPPGQSAAGFWAS